MAAKLFTLDEALALLPAVRQLVVEIQAAKQEVDAGSRDLESLLARSSGNGHLTADVEATRRSLAEAAMRLQRLIEELESTGAELKGIEEGLVDFRSLRDGRVIYFCWRLGEETIAYWHELDAGFAGRQPL